MPTTIGIRDLKNQTSRIVRSVREEMAEYVITLQGRPVALLRPLTAADEQQFRQTQIEEAIVEMKQLAQEVAAAWTSPKSGVDLISEQRR